MPTHIVRQGRRAKRLIPPRLAVSHPLHPNRSPAITTPTAAMTAVVMKPPERPIPQVIPRSFCVESLGCEVWTSAALVGRLIKPGRGLIFSIGISPFVPGIDGYTSLRIALLSADAGRDVHQAERQEKSGPELCLS